MAIMALYCTVVVVLLCKYYCGHYDIVLYCYCFCSDVEME